MSAADKLRNRIAVIEEQSEWGRAERAGAAEPVIAALPDIIAVIAAAERSCDAYTREAEDCNDGEFALWSKDDLVEAIVGQRSALAALNARLTGTSDGGAA